MSYREPKDLLDRNVIEMDVNNLATVNPSDPYNRANLKFDPATYSYPIELDTDPRTGIPVNRWGVGRPEGMDAEDFSSQNQSAFTKSAFGTAKFVGRTLNTFLGGTAGTIYGVGSALVNWDYKNIFDNEFTTLSDNVDKSLKEWLPNFHSRDERFSKSPLKGFIPFSQGSANFWFDKVGDGLGFTVGTILSELAWAYATAGVANIAKRSLLIPKGVSVLKGASAGDDIAKLMTKVATGGKVTGTGNRVNDALRVARQIQTSAGYEAGLEARMTMEDTRKKYEELYPNPSPEMEAWIEDQVEKAGMANYVHNLLLVGGGNFLQFPKIFGLQGKAINRSFKDIYRNTAGQYVNALANVSRGKNLVSNAYTLLKNPFYEGFVEEGGQGWSNRAVQDYFASKANPNNVDGISSLFYSGIKGFEEAYGTKEGLEEVSLGFIIGSIGAPGLNAGGGVVGALKGRQEKIVEINRVVEMLNQIPDAKTALQRNWSNASTQSTLSDVIDKAIGNKDMRTYQNARQDAIHSYVTSRIDAGFYDHVIEDIETMGRLSPEEFKKEIGVAADEELTADRQREIVGSFKKRAQDIKTIYDSLYELLPGDAATNPKNYLLRDAMVYSLATAQNLDSRERDMGKRLYELTDGALSYESMRYLPDNDAQEELKIVIEKLKGENLSDDQVVILRARKSALENIIKQDQKNNVKYYIEEATARLAEWANASETKTRPAIDYVEAQQLIIDLWLTKKYRQNLLQLYNDLFTEEGAAEFERKNKEWNDAVAKETEKFVNKVTNAKNVEDVQTIDDIENLSEEDEAAILTGTDAAQTEEEGTPKEKPLEDRLKETAARMFYGTPGNKVQEAIDQALYKRYKEAIDTLIEEIKEEDAKERASENKLNKKRKKNIRERVSDLLSLKKRTGEEESLEDIQNSKEALAKFIETYKDYESTESSTEELFKGAVSSVPGIYNNEIVSISVDDNNNITVKNLKGKETKLGKLSNEQTAKDLGLTVLKYTAFSIDNVKYSPDANRISLTIQGRTFTIDSVDPTSAIEVDNDGNPKSITLTAENGSEVVFKNSMLVDELAFVIEAIDNAVNTTINRYIKANVKDGFVAVEYDGRTYYIYNNPVGPAVVNSKTNKLARTIIAEQVLEIYKADIASVIDTALDHLSDKINLNRKELRNEIEKLDLTVRPASAGESIAAASEAEVLNAQEDKGQTKEETGGRVQPAEETRETIDEGDVVGESTEGGIEAQKADIERRRQETLLKYEERLKKDLNEIETDTKNYPKTININAQGKEMYGGKSIYENAIKAAQESFEYAKAQINAKYDAELAALEQPIENVEKEIIQEVAEDIEDNKALEGKEELKDNDETNLEDPLDIVEPQEGTDEFIHADDLEMLTQELTPESFTRYRERMIKTGLRDVSQTAAYNLNDNPALAEFLNNRANTLENVYAEAVLDVNKLTYNDTLKKFFSSNKDIESKLIAGQPLTESELERILTMVNAEEFLNTVDVLPIKLVLRDKSTNEVVWEDGIYYHNSNYNNIRIAIPFGIDKKDFAAYSVDYIKSEKRKIRNRRIEILSAILQNKPYRIGKLEKTRGHIVNGNKNTKITTTLGISPNEVEIGIAKANGVIFGANGPISGYGTKGALYMTTTKTVNGQKATIQLNPVKINKNQAKLILEGFRQAFGLGRGVASTLKDYPGYKGNLNISNMLSYLIHWGKYTLPTGTHDAYLASKQLFLENKKILRYGEDGSINLGNFTAEEAERFYNWVIENKNLAVSFKRLMDPKFVIPSDFEMAGITGVKGQSYREFILGSNDYVMTDIADPFFNKPNVILDMSTATTVGEKVEAKPELREPTVEGKNETPATEPNKKKRKIINPNADIFDKLRRRATPQPYKKMNFAQELAWYKANIGNESFVQLTDDMISMGEKGLYAFGEFSRAGILLWKDAAEGTLYHEAMHNVTVLLLSSVERLKLFEAMRKEGMVDVTDTFEDMHEKLAEGFALWKLNKDKGTKQEEAKGAVAKFFNRLYNILRFLYYYMFDANINSVEKLYNLVDSGAYRWRTTSSFNLKGLGKKKYYHSIDGFSSEEVKSWVKNMAYMLVDLNQVENLDDINNIKLSLVFDRLEKNVREYFEEFKKYETVDPELAEEYHRLMTLYESVLGKSEEFTAILKDYLRSLKIRTEEVHHDDVNIYNEDFNVESEFIEFDKSKFESSAKDNIRSEIKLMIETLPSSDELNSYNNLAEFANFGETWYTLMRNLHDADNVEEMMNRLSKMAESSVTFKVLLDRLAGNENRKTQFEITIKKNKYNYYNLFYDIRTKKVSIMNANIQSSQSKVLLVWGDSFVVSQAFVDGVPNTEYLKKVNDKYDTLVELSKEYTSLGKFADVNKIIANITSVLNDLSIGVNEKVITQKLLDANKSSIDEAAYDFITKKLSVLFSTNSIVESLINNKKITNRKGEDIPINRYLSTESFVKELAYDYLGVRPEDIDPSVLGPDGSVYFEYAEHLSLTNSIAQMKESNHLDVLLNGLYQRNSYLLEQLKDSKTRAEFGLEIFSGFYQENRKDTGRGFHDITAAEDYLSRIYFTINDKLALPTLADRKYLHLVSGLSRIPVEIEILPDGKYKIPDSSTIWDVFEGYLEDEWSSIQAAREEVDAAIESKNYSSLIKNYHYIEEKSGKIVFKDDKGNYVGNGTKFRHFPEFNTEYKPGGNRVLLKKIIYSVIKNELEQFEKAGLIAKNSENRYDNIMLDKSYTKKYEGRNVNLLEKYNKNENAALADILIDYIVNQMMTTIETSKMFMMDPAFYADQADSDKRITVLGSGGSLYRTSFPQGHELDGQNTFSSGIIKTNIIESKYVSRIRDILVDAYRREGYSEQEAATKAEERANAFKRVDPTDGQMIISPRLFRSLAIRSGEWSDVKQRAFELLESDNELSREEELMLAEIALQPLKTVYFGYEARPNGMIVPVYDKMSMFTLFKRFAKGKDIEALYNRMNATGEYEGMNPIDSLKYDTVVKTGSSMGVPFYDADGKVTDFRTSDFNVRAQDFRFLYKQQVTDPKMETDRLVGSQFIKVAMANAIDKSLAYEANSLMSELSNRGTKEFKDKYKVSSNEQTNRLFFSDLTPIVNELREAAVQAEMSDNVLDGLQLDENGKLAISLDTMSDRKWIYSRLISLINDYNVTLTMPGASMIQASSFGVKGQVEGSDHLKILSEDENHIEAEAIISISMFRNVIPNYKKLTHDERAAYIKDNPQVIGYRIPTQGYNSVLLIKVVDFLREEMGDVIMLPLEVTKITGSDFDVDKQYLVSYNYEVKDNKLSKIMYLNDSNSTLEERRRAFREVEGVDHSVEEFSKLSIIEQNTTKAIQNRLIDNWVANLKRSETVTQSLTPLDILTDKLKKLAELIDSKYEVKTEYKSLYSVTPSYTLSVKNKNKDSASGIAPFALHNVHHVLAQLAGLHLNIRLPFGNFVEIDDNTFTDLASIKDVDGEYITDMYSALISAFVDAVKDAYISRINVNPVTYDMVNLLLRSGAGFWTMYFINQPIIREYTQSENYTKFKKDFSENVNSAIAKYAAEKKFNEEQTIKFVEDYVKEFTKADIHDINKLEQDFGKEDGDVFYWLRQKAILDFYYAVNPIARSLNSLVKYSQIDTKKYGSSMTSVYDFTAKLYEKMNNKYFSNFDKLIRETFLFERLKNGPLFILSLMSDLTITSTNQFNRAVDSIFRISEVNTEEAREEIANKLFTFVASRFFTDPLGLNVTSDKVTSLLYGANSVANRVRLINTDKLFKGLDIKDKQIVKFLYAMVEDSAENSPDALITFNSQIKDKWSKDDLIRSWSDLLTHSNEDVKKFGEDLVLYAIYSSGMNKNIFSFYQYIPVNYLKTIGLSDYFNKFLEDAKLDRMPNVYQNAMEEIMLNSWYDSNIVPEISIVDLAETLTFNTGKRVLFKRKRLGIEEFKTWIKGANNKGQVVFKPFVKIKDGTDYLVYKYVGYDKQTLQPVYKLVSKRGYYNKGVKIIEMGFENSAIPFNNITTIPKDKESKINEYKWTLKDGKVAADYSDFVYVDDINIVDSSYSINDLSELTDVVHLSDTAHAIESLEKGTKNSILTPSIDMGQGAKLKVGDVIRLSMGLGQIGNSQYKVKNISEVNDLVLADPLYVEKLKVDNNLSPQEFKRLTKGITMDNVKYSVQLELIKTSSSVAKEKPTYDKPNFDKLPYKSETPTMFYAGIGSRETPAEIAEQMTKLAKTLEENGYTLRTGDAAGADTAFSKGTTKKEVYGAKNATDVTRAIAREIHPNIDALINKAGEYGLNLMARNTNQIFGENLDSPVDFVLTWTQDGATSYHDRSARTGGTGQAIDMASRKGIPVFNMNKPNWILDLNNYLKELLDKKIKQSPESKAKEVVAELKDTSALETSAEKPLKIYTDGSDIKGTGQIGYGAWVEYGDNEYEVSRVATKESFAARYGLSGEDIKNAVSNPTMELLAAVDILKIFMDTNHHIEILADYEGVQKWLGGEWKAKKPWIQDLTNIGKERIAKIQANGGSVTLTWVPGHTGVKGNERADGLAKNRSSFDTLSGLVNSPVSNKSTNDSVKKRANDGIAKVNSGLFDTILKERGITKNEIIKDLANANTNEDIANILKKIC